MDQSIQLIVGLANPGPEYAQTRHNAGAWFVEKIVALKHLNLRIESKLKGIYDKFTFNGQLCHLFIPTTFMNLSGQPVRTIMDYYKIPKENILIAHDDLDLPPGATRLKFNGGHGGHNGLRDVMKHLNSPAFHRLRIGIGHPGNAKFVTDYVLKKPTLQEYERIDSSLDKVILQLPEILAGHWQKAMKALHTSPT